MPEKHIVAQFSVVRGMLSGSIDFKDFADADFAVTTLSVIKIFVHQFVLS